MDKCWLCRCTFSPSSSIPFTSIYLGHFTAKNGELYVSLTPGFQDIVSGCNDNMEDKKIGAAAITEDEVKGIQELNRSGDVPDDRGKGADNVIDDRHIVLII